MTAIAATTPVGPAGEGVGVEARGLSKIFGPLRAVDDVSFELPSGSFLTVLGPNGAGKSTLLGLLAGGLKPTAGQVRIGGGVLEGDRARGVIGVLSHHGYLYDHLTAEENLDFYARLYGVPDRRSRANELLERVGLTDRARERVRGYSRGMRQRLALARTLLHDPRLVLLDEPYTGLDAHAATLLRDVLSELKDGLRTVVLVTHNLSEGLQLADRVAIMVRGRFAHVGEPARSVDEFARFYLRSVEGAL